MGWVDTAIEKVLGKENYLLTIFTIILLLGLGVLIVGILGSIPRYLNNLPVIVRIGLIIVGLFVAISTGLLLYQKANIPKAQSFHRADIKKYGIKIHSPLDHSVVSSPIIIIGSFQLLPPDNAICIIETTKLDRYKVALSHYPKGWISFNKKEKTWSIEVNVGTNSGSNHDLQLYYLGKNGNALINYYLSVRSFLRGKQIESLVPIEELTDDMYLLDEIRIILK